MLGVGEAHSISNSSDYRKSNVTLFEHIQSHREVIVLSKLLTSGSRTSSQFMGPTWSVFRESRRQLAHSSKPWVWDGLGMI